jgi:hypothetical protein
MNAIEAGTCSRESAATLLNKDTDSGCDCGGIGVRVSDRKSDCSCSCLMPMQDIKSVAVLVL